MGETRILLRSDDEAAAAVLAELAGRRGYELLRAADEDAFLDGRAASPSLIVVDLDGGHGNGLATLQELALARCEPPVLLVGSCDLRTLEAARRVGARRGLTMARVLRKPLHEKQIVRPVLDALGVDDPTLTADELSAALARDELALHYQPLVDVVSGSVRSVEALLRWPHPAYGPIHPARVVSLAERSRMAGELTRWVTRAALRQMHRWMGEGWDFTMSVNASGAALAEGRFADDIAALADEERVPTSRLVLEITESQAITERVEVLEAVTALRLLGVELAIDDFGTGYSSLGRLHRMPFSELKIDKSFVLDTAGNPDAEVIVRAIANLGRDLGLTVVAEGVSTREAWDLVARVGCDVAQGYFMSRPLPADELDAWLQRWDVPGRLGVRAARDADGARGPHAVPARNGNAHGAPRRPAPA